MHMKLFSVSRYSLSRYADPFVRSLDRDGSVEISVEIKFRCVHMQSIPFPLVVRYLDRDDR